MRTRWCEAMVLAAAGGLAGCGGDIIPDLSGPISVPTTACLDATEWHVYGFSDTDVREGEALLLPVGHSRELFVLPRSFGAQDCDEAIVSLQWVSTRPDVAGGFAPGPGRRWAWLTAVAPGETFVSAEVNLSDGRVVTAPLTWRGTVYPVRVVPASATPADRSVLLEGTVDLEPEDRTATPATRAYLVFLVPVAGVLDMTVNWDSPSNRVIAHMCQGEVSPPRGCSPIIDGTIFDDRKPVSASTPTTPGTHTLWITNSGPEAERVRYQVGLIPG